MICIFKGAFGLPFFGEGKGVGSDISDIEMEEEADGWRMAVQQTRCRQCILLI